ncbi:hypothetical protein EW146_g4986 [Bondarzewia mesenterica]|uniref:PUB domain-containing protein n=1 Tax=Bondarzewia mesenterica TaxID=1095465 RepID=A0A4S4LUN3_9AGAM|nr:hypothetical protein EW146_g4986 [Bondarzewia mesenterica]
MSTFTPQESSTQSPPQSPPHSPLPADDREARLAALQHRLEQEQIAAGEAGSAESGQLAFQPFDRDHEKRQEFRRLLDPGILRPNAKEVATASMHTLSTMAENILREPDNPKFRQFKPTNALIKRDLVDPKGTLEYAVALGFRPEVRNFQPFYVFNDKHLPDLRIGAAILKEVVQIESEKHEREERSKRLAKAEKEARIEKVKKAILDDRKSKMLRDQLKGSSQNKEQ